MCPNVPCPYDLPEENVTWADVKRQLALEDHFEVEAGSTLEGNVTPSAFIVAALELEEAQQSLVLDVQKTSAGNVTKAMSIQRRRTGLLMRIQSYISTRAQHMPGLERYLHNLMPTHGDHDVSMWTPKLIPLHLPSSLPLEKRASVCVPGLAEIEDRLRFAQACEALTDLQCQLTKRTYASRYRTASVSSQTHFTRFRELQEQTDSKIKLACSRYRAARSGLVHLREEGTEKEAAGTPSPEDWVGVWS